MKPEQFLFGCAYYDEYMPVSRIDEDFRLMKEANMNVIRIAESTWSTWEQQEGKFDFSSLIRMLEGARKYGLSVIIGTPTYAFPSWLSDLDPEVLTTTASGHALYGHRQLTDLNNPTYRKYTERVLRKLLEKCRPYNDIIIGYQLDNETRSAGAAGKIAQQIFAQRMKERFHGDLEAFNKEFGMDYWSNKVHSWEKFPDVRGTINGSLDAEYRAFLRDTVTEFLAWLKDIIDDYRAPGQFITHNFDFAWTGYSFGMQPEVNQKDAASFMDIPGVDAYHPSAELLTGTEISMAGAIGRSLKKENYLVLETQAQGRPSWTPFSGQLTLQALSHLASGAGSVMYWHWHSIHNAYETYWKGILSHNLKPNAPYRELHAFGAMMAEHGAKLSYLKKTSGVAILLDNRSLTGIDEFPLNGEEAFKGDSSCDYNHMMRRWYDACYRNNIEVDFVYCDDDFSSYKLLIIPALYACSDTTLNSIRAFIGNGGHVIITPKSFFCDEFLKVRADDQPYDMTDLTGGTYDEFSVPSVPVKLKGSLPLTGTASEFIEFYRINEDDTSALASYDHPYYGDFAAVMRRENVTTVGCLLDNHDTEAVLKDCLEHAGITVPEVSFPVIVKKGINKDGEEITFVLNYSMDASEHTIEKGCSEVINGNTYRSGDKVTLKPWGYLILEACASA
ncbi:MAG: beta-galactosidase [Clostridiales bacterium]|nr:beta-galactosidase [Clostridiales bacterium]